MARPPAFSSIGSQSGNIDVRLSYRIIELFSEGLYASPNKAIEELVANSFDAGARRVSVLLSPSLQDQAATIVVMDDGEGMDVSGLNRHWLIGISEKRRLTELPRGRQQIGKFGIGKLATYVLAGRLTHISKSASGYLSTSMDYSAIDTRVQREIEPKTPIKLVLRKLTEAQAIEALSAWTNSLAYKSGSLKLFGKGAPKSWTAAIMSDLREKVHEIRPGHLEWVLRTALPLRPDFEVWLSGKRLIPSKQGKGLIKKWILGKDLKELPKPAPKGAAAYEDSNADLDGDRRFGIEVPTLGRITGYAEAYKDLLTGKSDEIGRSYGFFVYVFGRLVNVQDGHFGISPDELRHGSFGRFRCVVHIDKLDEQLRSNREAISEGPLLEAAQDVLKSIFNAVRATLEKHDSDEEPGARLARKIAASPASLSRRPIVDLARAVIEGRGKSRYLTVPENQTKSEREAFLKALESRSETADDFVSGLSIDYDGSQADGIARFDTSTGVLRVNAWHPFVGTFYDEFVAKDTSQPLSLFAMAEVLIEAHLHALGIAKAQIEDFLSLRDQLLRNIANESGRKSAFVIASDLRNARNNPTGLEGKLCAAFTSLGFEVTPIGKKGQADGVAIAYLSAAESGKARQYRVSLEAKSKEKLGAKVSAKSVGVSTIARQRNDLNCNHAVVVGPAFPTSQGDKSALAKEIDDDREKGTVEDPRTITLITIDDLARLVRLRPVKGVKLSELRSLFDCRLPEESQKWVDQVRDRKIKKPPYKAIVQVIESLQKKYHKAPVKYASLRVELSHSKPPIEFETDDELMELCRAMAQMAPEAMSATKDMVELDQSAANVIVAIEGAMNEYPVEDRV